MEDVSLQAMTIVISVITAAKASYHLTLERRFQMQGKTLYKFKKGEINLLQSHNNTERACMTTPCFKPKQGNTYGIHSLS